MAWEYRSEIKDYMDNEPQDSRNLAVARTNASLMKSGLKAKKFKGASRMDMDREWEMIIGEQVGFLVAP